MMTETRVGADNEPSPSESLADMPLTYEQAEETRAGGAFSKVGPGHLILPTANN